MAAAWEGLLAHAMQLQLRLRRASAHIALAAARAAAAAAISATATYQGCMPSVTEAVTEAESRCCICFGLDWEDDNMILFCDGPGNKNDNGGGGGGQCKVAVHQQCYGVLKVPPGTSFRDT